ncbi:solute carrier family 25 (mitochondrial carnitine/acylcarnitine transporter) member 20/29 [Cryptococcus deuterogattii R265]|uniref:solute carrier family 25 (mitochondrial carnitine/acylcarnitine transporter) member 20/29 n=1 Tax=Cryptococcus deuterogattii (strain R265) TaxID=294750 RepID=UPI0019385F01|nr:solute carrier family 25 (mitochondrial carnitine/acylcarnitine transporter) member 20/29 [Cryptococcus deuterogattii R265]
MAVPEEISDPDIYADIPEGRSGSPPKEHSPFIGFAAGICSGWTKLIVGHPFDTLKTRLQCAPSGTFNGAWDCFKKTVNKEGPRALYKGASIPAISWGITDSILMGSLHNYRAFLSAHGLGEGVPNSDQQRLSLLGHSVAGLFAGWTNATVAHPTEIIKCKLQLQLVQPEHVPRQFSGPIDVVRQTVTQQGVTGMWRGLGASFIYRSCFAAMFGSFEAFNRLFKSWDGTNWAMSAGLANFLAGGMASNAYWLTALPLDNVKNRIMTDDIKTPRYKGVYDAYRQVWNETYNDSKGLGWNVLARTKNFYRGFVPVAMRAFPTNAAALAVWEGVMRWSKA